MNLKPYNNHDSNKSSFLFPKKYSPFEMSLPQKNILIQN